MTFEETSAAQHPPPPKVPRYIFIGFNSSIDRNSIAKLLGVVGGIVERKPVPQALVLCISSDGGNMESAFYGYEILRSLPVAIATHNLSLVASAANLLFMAGSVRYAAPESSFLFHNTKVPITSPGIANQEELRLTVEGTRQADRRCANIIAERIGKPQREVRRWFDEKFRTAEFALKVGIISKICPLSVGHEDVFVQILP
jgi:ATP-dependent protease ClpP protease subunit